MNLTTSKRDLLRIATRMAGVAQKKSTMPALACTRLTAAKGALLLEATDLFLSLDGSVPADVETPGTYAVSAHELVERVKAMADGPVVVEAKERSLTLKSKGTARRFTMRGMPGEDFPPVAHPDSSAAHIPLDASTIARLISHTVFSVSTDETRPHLNAALVEVEGGVARMVATDGHRLSKSESHVDGHGSARMLVPLKAVQEVRRLAEDLLAAQVDDRSIRVIAAGPHAFFIANGMTFGAKLVDAQFPPWQQVIPTAPAKMLRAPRALLADAIRAVSVAADSKTNGVRLALSKGLVRLSSESADSGDGVDEVPVEYAGANMSIGFAAKYMLDVLGAVSTDEVEVGLNDELAPIVIRPLGFTGGDAVFVVMPMRI